MLHIISLNMNPRSNKNAHSWYMLLFNTGQFQLIHDIIMSMKIQRWGGLNYVLYKKLYS